MIEKDNVHFRFYGEDFKPSRLRNILHLTNVTEPGLIGVKGRYKGLPYPYGAASLGLLPEEEGHYYNDKIDLLLKQIERNKEAIEKAHIESITLDIFVGYRDQCNLEFDASILKRLGDLNISINLSAVDCELMDMKTEAYNKSSATSKQELKTVPAKLQTKTNGRVKPLEKAVKAK